MQVYWTLLRRELSGYFFSITGYVVIAAVAFLLGLTFDSILEAVRGESLPMPITELFFRTYYFWIILLLTVPIITMRLFAQEKFSGTFETLMTAPVSDFQVVVAKFSSAVVFYTIMCVPLLACVLIPRYFTSDPGALDFGVIGATFLGVFLVGGVLLALGCFASALTRSQMTAAMISFFFGLGLFLLSFLADQIQGQATWQTQVLSYFALSQQMHDFARGVVDTRSVVFYLSLTFLSLFLTLRVVQSRRWK
jgi:ABC-2 type transport system permease protein